MKKSMFTEEQIAFALRQEEAGTPVAERAVTPVAWRLEPTPTPGPVQQRSGGTLRSLSPVDRRKPPAVELDQSLSS